MYKDEVLKLHVQSDQGPACIYKVSFFGFFVFGFIVVR